MILNHGQVTKATPQLAPTPSPNFDTPPKGGRLSLHRFNVHCSPTRRVFSNTSSNSRHAGHESVTLTTRLPRPHVYAE
ncbi:hypothetical protein TNCV_832611 [Trichonephila clavipes]|nr:hypothetical protein TNCV_832611 [Trichonephila clavipes]